jgi:two-component system, LytTR family, sensor kinase
MWLALRAGWLPLWRSVPLQVLFGFGFSMLTTPALVLGEHLVGGGLWHQMPPNAVPSTLKDFFTGPGLPLWLAGATSSLLTYGFGLALLTGFDIYRRLRDSELRSAALERSLSAAHLAALRMQLSPHTLFNLLHTIRGQISWDPAAAQSMVVQLGDLLRRLLRAGERDLSRLPDEIAFVRLYLDLQQRRFSDRLTVSVPPTDQLPAAWVPSLILQPLVENAVVHGLGGHDGPVTICVEVMVVDDSLSLRVVNSTARYRSEGERGIGLKNVHNA